MVLIQAIGCRRRPGLAAPGPARDVQLAEAARVLLALPGLPGFWLPRSRRRLLRLGSSLRRGVAGGLRARGALRLLILDQVALLVLLAGTAMARIVAAELASRGFCQGPPPSFP